MRIRRAILIPILALGFAAGAAVPAVAAMTPQTYFHSAAQPDTYFHS